jgi:hypothetical protein
MIPTALLKRRVRLERASLAATSCFLLESSDDRTFRKREQRIVKLLTPAQFAKLLDNEIDFKPVVKLSNPCGADWRACRRSR